MHTEALVSIAGEAGETVKVSSPGFPSGGHASVNTSVTLTYNVAPRHHGGFIVFITDDWILTDNMCLTVHPVHHTSICRLRLKTYRDENGIFIRNHSVFCCKIFHDYYY